MSTRLVHLSHVLSPDMSVDVPRAKRFSENFINQLLMLFELLTKEVYNERIRGTDIHVLANFVSSMTCLIDRGVVISMVHVHSPIPCA